MLNIYYCDGGMAYSDFELDDMVSGLIDLANSDMTYAEDVSTDNIVYALRVAIYKGEVDPSRIKFILDGKTALTMDKTGRPTNGSLPETYLDRYLDTLIGL